MPMQKHWQSPITESPPSIHKHGEKRDLDKKTKQNKTKKKQKKQKQKQKKKPLGLSAFLKKQRKVFMGLKLQSLAPIPSFKRQKQVGISVYVSRYSERRSGNCAIWTMFTSLTGLWDTLRH